MGHRNRSYGPWAYRESFYPDRPLCCDCQLSILAAAVAAAAADARCSTKDQSMRALSSIDLSPNIMQSNAAELNLILKSTLVDTSVH